MADMALLSAFAHAGDSILSLDAESGGYVGISEIGYPRLLGLKNLYFPFDRARWSIRVDETVQLITSEKPRLVVLGASFIVFPHPVQQLKKACLETGAMLTYDASHVLGLIAGGVFQDPLGEGAKVLVGSTHKSFFGPQGGIIAAFETEGEKLGKTIYPAIVDNAHWNRIAALAVALLEIRKFGRQYARQVVRNSRALAEALDDDKVPVRCREYGYTQSHQLLLNTDQLNGWERIPDKLEDANVIVDRGIRLGTSEMTRRGMREREMNQIAAIIGDVIHGRRTPREAKRRAMALAKRFRGVCYC
jgi:glycine hydroxymethyltransferase